MHTACPASSPAAARPSHGGRPDAVQSRVAAALGVGIGARESGDESGLGKAYARSICEPHIDYFSNA
ncbi:hypothetical protein OKW38_007073 [Paraburkholderia sp. MM5496-R1]